MHLIFSVCRVLPTENRLRKYTQRPKSVLDAQKQHKHDAADDDAVAVAVGCRLPQVAELYILCAHVFRAHAQCSARRLDVAVIAACERHV